jgi:hypothetical protein
MTLAITLAGLICMTVGAIFYLISLFMERYYDRKLNELDRKLKQDQKWREQNER